MTRINETHVILTGGVGNGETLIVNLLTNFTMTKGPTLKSTRYWHACGTFSYQGQIQVIVAGGFDGGNHVYLPELWNPASSDAGWIQGEHIITLNFLEH